MVWLWKPWLALEDRRAITQIYQQQMKHYSSGTRYCKQHGSITGAAGTTTEPGTAGGWVSENAGSKPSAAPEPGTAGGWDLTLVCRPQA